MKKYLVTTILFSFFLSPGLHAQRDSLSRVFRDAESWFLFEEYADALPLYEELLKIYPGNDNLHYRIGICLLNDPFRKDQSIYYLQKASRNTNPAHKETSLKEMSAPVDALFYLGNAYLVNELFSKAVESYEEFLELMDSEVYDEELVRSQIACCENALKLKESPLDLDLYLLETSVNSKYSEIHPVISGDGLTLAYIKELPFYDGAFVTRKQADGTWGYPLQVTQQMGFDENVYPVSLNHDGTRMILYSNDNYIGNLYLSEYRNGMWQKARKMGEPISSKYWESNACFSKDEKTLYFTSNRKGGFGDLDIYRSELGADGRWGTPENLGPVINTRLNEESPWISEDGRTLFFSSYGHYNMGGYDIFRSTLDDNGNWSEPENVGYPINTTDDDLHYQPVDGGLHAYYSIYSPVGAGRYDIYYLTLYDDEFYPRYYPVSGRLRGEDSQLDKDKTSVIIKDLEKGDTLHHANIGEDGSFSLELPKGAYEVSYDSDGYEKQDLTFRIDDKSDIQGLLLGEAALLQEERPSVILEGNESKIDLSDTAIVGLAGITKIIDVKAPKGMELIVTTWQENFLVSRDTLITKGRYTELAIVPQPGTSRIVLEFTDEEGVLHRNHVHVTGAVRGTRGKEETTFTPKDESPAAKVLESVQKAQPDLEEVMAEEGRDGDPMQDDLVEVDSSTMTELEQQAADADEAEREEAKEEGSWPWWLLLLGGGLLVLLILYLRRRRKVD